MIKLKHLFLLPGTLVDFPLIVSSVDSVAFDTFLTVVAMVGIVPFKVFSVVALSSIVELNIIPSLVVTRGVIESFFVVFVVIKVIVCSVDIFIGLDDSETVDTLITGSTVVSFVVGIVPFVAANN